MIPPEAARFPRWRLLWLLAIFIVQGLYFPINQAAQGAASLAAPAKAYIPLWPVWAIPYLLAAAWWLAFLVWACAAMEDADFRALAIAAIGVMLVSYLVYLVFPLRVDRPEVSGDGLAARLLRWIYAHDRPYNTFPSSHAYFSALIYFFWRRWKPRLEGLWGGLALLTLFSTLFTHQHVAADLAGGVLLAWAGYRLSYWRPGKYPIRPDRPPAGKPGVGWYLTWSILLLLGVGNLVFFAGLSSDASTGGLESFSPEGFRVERVLENRVGGLQAGDVILLAAGHAPEKWLNGIPGTQAPQPGQEVAYRVLREGQPYDLIIRLRPTHTLSVAGRWLIQLVVIAVIVTTAGFVFTRRRAEQSARLFTLFSLATAMHAWRDTYNFPFPLVFHAWQFWGQFWLEQITYLLSYALACHFFLVFPHAHPWLQRRPRLVLGLVYGLPWPAILLPLLLAPTTSQGVQISNSLAIGMSILQTGLSTAALLRSVFKVENAVERAQALWIAWGTLLPMAVIIAGYFVPILLSIPPFLPEPFTVLALILIPLVMGIAVLRFHLWDIDLLINRSLVYGLLTLLVVLIYLLGVSMVQSILRAATGQETNWAVLIIVLLIALVFQPLREKLQGLVDRRFYRQKLDFRQAFHSFSQEVRRFTNLPELLRLLVYRLAELFHSSFGAVYLDRAGNGDFELAESTHPDAAGRLELGDEQAAVLRSGQPLAPAENAPYAVLLPLMAPRGEERQWVGVLALGPRRSGMGYGSEELALLSTLVGEAGTAVSLAQALTEKQKALQEREAALVSNRENEEKFYRIFYRSPAPITIRRAGDGCYVDANQSFLDTLGYERHEVIGRTPYELGILARPEHGEVALDAREQDLPIRDYEVPFRKKNGNTGVATLFQEVIDLGGEPHIIATSLDITDRKRAESELLASRAAEEQFARRLRALSEVTTELSQAESVDALCRRAVELALSRLDLDRMSIWFISEDRHEMLGTFGVDACGTISDERGAHFPLDPGSHITPVVQGRNLLVHAEDTPLYFLGKVVGRGTLVTAGLWDGKNVIGFLSVDNLLRRRPFDERDYELLRLFASAIGHLCTLRRTQEALTSLTGELEQRVVQRTAQLEFANRELDAFNYSISHDLRAPLRSLDGFSSALEENLADKIDSQSAEYLRRLRAAARRMDELINDLLKLSRLTRGSMARSQTNLSALAEEVLRTLAEAHPERRVECVVQPGLQAVADPRLLRIVLENLLGNAWKFTGKCAAARIEFGACTTPQGGRTFCVRDNGAGFDMAYADRLFGVFQRLHSSSEFEGTGIGLTIVQRIIHRHGGKIWAEAQAGQGAAFYFTLDENAPDGV